MNITAEQERYFFNIDSLGHQRDFRNQLYSFISQRMHRYSSIIFLCIGTDRATGDSLGPLIGHKLRNIRYPNVHVYGTLESPVHAKNIQDITAQIYNTHCNPLIIAIDACLGKIDHIGYISFGEGTIKPGAGVNKDLPEVGDLFITGIVNFSGFMDMVILQNTRLNLVMKMADFIAFAIKSALWKYYHQYGAQLG